MDEGQVEAEGRPMPSISRRRFLYGAAAAVGGMTLASCSGGGILGSGRTVHFWNLFGGGDGARLGVMEDKFRSEYPRLNLSSTTLSWGAPYYTKLSMSAVGGSPPDVAIMHLSKMGAYATVGLLEPLDPDELSEFDIGPEKFLPKILDSAKVDGELYALPLDTHPFVMYYNTDICKKAGLLDSGGNLKPIQGPDEIIAALKKAKEVTGAWGLSFYPANDPAGNWRLFNSLYGQLGGKVLSPDAKEVVIDDAKAEKALEFMADLTLDSKVMPTNQDYAGSVALFQGGQAGFHWNGEWEVTTFEDAKMPFSIVPFPNVFGNNTTQADRHTFVIPRGVSAGGRRAALEFVSSMMKNSFTWAEGGHIPAYQPVATSEKYKQLEPQSNYAGVADDVALDPVAWFSGSGSQLEMEASGAFQSVMSGKLTPKQGIDQFRAALYKLVKTPSPVK
jgi:multiple sugar transport system substrate-binding protein